MFQLARLDRRVAASTLPVVANASIEIRRQGATVKNDQNKTTGQAINVEDIGALKAADTVKIYRASVSIADSGGTFTFNVDSVSVTNRTVSLSGYAGTLALQDDDRISPVNSLPSLYNDSQRVETKSNPLTTSSTGQATSWLEQGYYDRLITNGANSLLLEDDYVAASYTYNVRDARYGARGDGVTDDTVAIQRAITEAHEDGVEGQGGIVEIPPGIYKISSQITVPGSRLIVRGHGRRCTILQATAGFSFNGTTDAIVRLGPGSLNTYSRLESMTIDAFDVANSICFYSTDIQENSGCHDVNCIRYRVKGVFVGGTFSAQNYLFRDMEFLPSASGSTAIGMDLNAAGRPCLQNITFNPYDGATAQAGPAIKISSGGQWLVSNINIERHTTGIQVNAGTGGVIMVVNTNLVTTNIDIKTNGWIVMSGGTGTISDTATGGFGGSFSTNNAFYIASNNGPVSKTRYSDDSDAPSVMNSPYVFLSSVDVARFTATRATAHVAGDYAISAGWGTTAVLTVATGTNDTAGQFIVNSNGAGLGANPAVTLTFKQGAFTNAPVVLVTRASDSGDQFTVEWTVSRSTTQAIFVWRGTPTGGSTDYRCNFMIIGK